MDLTDAIRRFIDEMGWDEPIPESLARKADIRLRDSYLYTVKIGVKDEGGNTIEERYASVYSAEPLSASGVIDAVTPYADLYRDIEGGTDYDIDIVDVLWSPEPIGW